ncbi:MAG: OmpA family protein [Deltaproteobacteria bacterium]|nr:OmpA family protein [Deltaproteobacteria bacterium]
MRIMIAVVSVVLITALALGGCCKKYQEQIASQTDEIGKQQIEIDQLSEERAALSSNLESVLATQEKLETTVAELAARIASMAEYRQALEEELSKLGFDKEAMDAKYQTALAEQQRLIDEMKQRQARAQARLDTLKNMLNKFKKLIEGGKLNVRIRDGKLMLELPSAVLFPLGKAEISEDGAITLREVANVLAQIDGREFQVAGHTDDVPITSGRFEDNWQLSAARSVAVVRALIEMGVDPKGLSASGYSKYRPTASNNSKENKAQNRRIEIILMPNLDELPDLSALEGELK